MSFVSSTRVRVRGKIDDLLSENKEFFDQYARVRARQDVFCSCGHMTIVFRPVRARAKIDDFAILKFEETFYIKI